MATILLTKGIRTLVDDDMFEELNRHSWHASGIDFRPARRRIEDRKMIYLYHQVLNVLPWILRADNLCVDHINHNPLDNRKSNLRIVTIAENNSNRFKGKSGIGYDGTHGKYKAYIDVKGYKRYNVGTFKHRIEAEHALAQAKMELEIEDN